MLSESASASESPARSFCGIVVTGDVIAVSGPNVVTPAAQVVGDTQAAFDITQYDTLVFGANGLLLAGPNSRTYEPLLASYLQLISMDLFVRNLFVRVLVVMDDFKEVRTVSVCMSVCAHLCACGCALARRVCVPW